MKKLILLVAVITAVSFASCSNKAKETTPPEVVDVPELVQEEATLEEEATVESTDAVEVEAVEEVAE